MSEKYSPVVFAGGGEVADAYPLVVVKSDTARVSVLPVAGCNFPAVVLGKVWALPCLRVDSDETLLTVIDERAQLARAALGVTPVDSSEEGAPVPELIKLSVLGEPQVDSLQEPMPSTEWLEYAIQATALIWKPLEQVRYVVSGDMDFDSFGMAPWDTVQITFIFIGQTHLVFGKRVCTCVTKHSNAFRTFLNWLKNSKRVWHEPKLHILRLPLFANFDL